MTRLLFKILKVLKYCFKYNVLSTNITSFHIHYIHCHQISLFLFFKECKMCYKFYYEISALLFKRKNASKKAPWSVSCLDSFGVISIPFFSQLSWGFGMPSAWHLRLAVTPGSRAWLSGYTRITGGTKIKNRREND